MSQRFVVKPIGFLKPQRTKHKTKDRNTGKKQIPAPESTGRPCLDPSKIISGRVFEKRFPDHLFG